MAPGWLAAQTADRNFISDYAKEYPETEDMAESFVPFFAAEYRADRIPSGMVDTIRGTIPNRIAYFKSLALDMRPAAPQADGQPPDPEPPPTDLRLHTDHDGPSVRRRLQGQHVLSNTARRRGPGQVRHLGLGSGGTALVLSNAATPRYSSRFSTVARSTVTAGSSWRRSTDLEFNLWVTGPNGRRWTHGNSQQGRIATANDNQGVQLRGRRWRRWRR